MRVLVVTSLYPTAEHPERGRFVADQVESLRRIDGVEVDVFRFEPGAANYVTAARHLRRAHGSGRYDVVHAHVSVVSPVGYAAAVIGRSLGLPVMVTFHSVLRHKRHLLRAANVLARISSSAVVWDTVRLPAQLRSRSSAWLPRASRILPMSASSGGI